GGLSSANRKLKFSGSITILGSSPSSNSTGDSILPAQVALAQDNVFDGNLQNPPLPHDYHCFLFINSFHHSDPVTEQCHAVAFHQRSLELLLCVVPPPQLDDVVQPIRVIPGAVLPEPNGFAISKHEDVSAKRDQLIQSRV